MLHSRFIISGLALMGLLGAAWAQFTLGPDPVPWGWNEAVPVHGDYDGDGRIDAAVYWPAAGNWYILPSSTWIPWVQNWGWSETVPVPADYDADGRTDLAVYHSAAGNWYILFSGGGAPWVRNWGWRETIPVPGDYDADGKADLAVYHPPSGRWYIEPYAYPITTDTNTLNALWAAAVTNAHSPNWGKVWRRLTPVRRDNSNLCWRLTNNEWQVKAASFMAPWIATNYIPGAALALPTNSISWVTMVPELRNFCRNYRLFAGTNYLGLRVLQLLGMPWNRANNTVVEYWVNPKYLARPSADPAITDNQSEPDFAYTNSLYCPVNPLHYSWYTNELVANTWPWSRLGYTYDWANPNSRGMGLSEFIIPAKMFNEAWGTVVTVYVESVTLLVDY